MCHTVGYTHHADHVFLYLDLQAINASLYFTSAKHGTVFRNNTFMVMNDKKVIID